MGSKIYSSHIIITNNVIVLDITTLVLNYGRLFKKQKLKIIGNIFRVMIKRNL